MSKSTPHQATPPPSGAHVARRPEDQLPNVTRVNPAPDRRRVEPWRQDLGRVLGRCKTFFHSPTPTLASACRTCLRKSQVRPRSRWEASSPCSRGRRLGALSSPRGPKPKFGSARTPSGDEVAHRSRGLIAPPTTRPSDHESPPIRVEHADGRLAMRVQGARPCTPDDEGHVATPAGTPRNDPG